MNTSSVNNEFLKLERLARLKRAREGSLNAQDQALHDKYKNHPFVQYVMKLGYQKYLAIDSLEQHGDDALTDTLLSTVLQTYAASLQPTTTSQLLYSRNIGQPY